MPSRTLPGRGEIESFGISYLEAGACGKPVVAGRGGGTAEAVEDGVTGLLVDPWDPEDVARAVIRLLKDGDLARRLGMAGRQRALEEPAWEHLRLD
jgi:phosphatidylinositol alpha-1,6-mannosyltransferase